MLQEMQTTATLSKTVDLGSSPTVSLFISSESASSERRFDKSITIGALKERLEPITGVGLQFMKLKLYSGDNKFVCNIDDDSKMLGYYPVQNYMLLDVLDTNPQRTKAQYTDLSLVEKYEMAEEEYEKRQDSVRAFKKRNKIGRFADNAEELKAKADVEFQAEAESIILGSRCLVEPVEGGLQKRGKVLFVGKTHFKPGFWVGIRYDEPLGKHDGKVEGERYFTCEAKHGAFVRPNKVVCGDYPEEELDFSDEEM